MSFVENTAFEPIGDPGDPVLILNTFLIDETVGRMEIIREEP